MHVPRLGGSLFKRSRRRLYGGIILLVLGGLVSAYSVPKVIDNLGTLNQSRQITGPWPPDIISSIEYERQQAREEFYRWVFFTSCGVLIALLGAYFGIIRWIALRSAGKG